MDAGPPLRSCTDDAPWALVTSAFVDDPVERWLYPDLDDYQREFPRFARALGGRSIDAGTAWCSDAGDAVAAWLPPGTAADEDAVVDVLMSTVAPDKHPDMITGLEQMAEHHPREPHWYLVWLAVDPAAQGRGAGGRLLSRCLAHIATTGLPAYLETPNPRTIPFYQRHGFAVVGQTDAGDCPPLTFMSRTVRPESPTAAT